MIEPRDESKSQGHYRFMPRNTVAQRFSDIWTLARGDWTAYFRASAIDHPATDASSILDFPARRDREREERQGDERAARAPGVAPKRNGARSAVSATTSGPQTRLYLISRELLPATKAVKGDFEESILSPCERDIRTRRDIVSRDQRRRYTGNERRFELIGHPMGTAGARNNCPQ